MKFIERSSTLSDAQYRCPVDRCHVPTAASSLTREWSFGCDSHLVLRTKARPLAKAEIRGATMQNVNRASAVPW